MEPDNNNSKKHHNPPSNEQPPGLKSILRNKNEISPQMQLKDKEKIIQNPTNNDQIEMEQGNVSIFNPKAKSVHQYAYEENSNKKYRQAMEDFQKVVDRFNKDPNKGYFSLFDGHGGTQVVEYVRDRLVELFTQYYNETNDITKSFKKSFENIDKELKKIKGIENMGSTATCVFITKESDVVSGTKRVVYCANLGDTRCVLLGSGGCKRLSCDHKCNDENEAHRIKKSGGSITDNRVMGKLALTRTFGDYSMKAYGVTATPTINKMNITDSDSYIVLCSDGVWDVIDEEDLFYFGFQCTNARDLAVKIVQESISRNSTDNISCLVLKL